MNREIESKIFERKNFESQADMENAIKKYMNELKRNYPKAIVTREFYKSNGALVRATMTDARKYSLLEEELRAMEAKKYGLKDEDRLDKLEREQRERDMQREKEALERKSRGRSRGRDRSFSRRRT